MELLERYLYAVSKYLPQASKKDLTAELRENLLAQFEDEEANLGRPLTTDEIAEILRKHGRPLVVALQYLPQRHLIGPVMFPWFWYVLRIAVPFGAVISLIAYVSQVLFFSDGHFAFSHLFSGLLSTAFNVAASVTLIFAVGEFFLTRYHAVDVKDALWDPRTLPRVERDARGETPRWTYAADVIVNALLTLWLVAIPFHPFLLMGHYESFLAQHSIHLTMVWRALYWILVALSAGQTVIKMMVLLTPRLRVVAGIASNALAVAAFAILAVAHNYFVLDAPLRPQDAVVLEQVNRGLHIAFAVALTIASIILVQSIFRYGSRTPSKHLYVAL